MATLVDDIRPGDIISSDLMRRIVQMLNDHELKLGGTPSGVVVPSLFGKTVAQAKTILPLQKLTLGVLVDTAGASVDPNAAGADTRLILGQVPSAGQGTFLGGSVDLLVAGTGSGTGPVVTPLAFTNIDQPTAPVNGQIELQGSGFGAGVADNSVTFDGIVSPVLPGSTTTRLLVNVPPGIPGAPTAPGQPSKPNVVVQVRRVADNATQSRTMTVAAPLANPLTITSFEPASATGLIEIKINGTGFSTTKTDFEVQFDTVNATPNTATATQLKVTIPANIPGLSQAGDSKTVKVQVKRLTDSALSGKKNYLIEL